MNHHRYLVTDRFWLDCAEQRLWLDGRPSSLAGKPIRILQFLMERPQSLVTKRELFDLVWPGLAVTDSVLTTAVKEARQALGDNARDPAVIETVHGRGYRFKPGVHATDAAPQRPAPRSRRLPLSRLQTWIAAAVLALAVAAAGLVILTRLPSRHLAEDARAPSPNPQSVAVLPFQDLSAKHDQGWFAAGLTEEILNSLARTPDLRVASRTSTSSLPPSDVRSLGRRLNVAHILEGSVRRDGGRVRVTAQLIRTSDGFHVWSQDYDRPAGEVISIQENLAVAIARALNTVMRPDKLQQMVRLGTPSVEAYEEYLHGLAYEEQQLETGNKAFADQAALAFERARTIDPLFAAAQWEAAQHWYSNDTRVGAALTQSEVDEHKRLEEYLRRIDAAVASSQGRPENLKYRSARALADLNLVEALSLMQRYLAEVPRDFDALDRLVDLAAYVGDRRLMAQAGQRIHAFSMEAGAPKSRAITASVLSLAIPQAVDLAHEQLARSPDQVLTEYQAHRALLWGGRRGEARRLLLRLRSSSLPPENLMLAELRQACADGGAAARTIVAANQGKPFSLSTRWQEALLLGEDQRARAMLMPLNRSNRLGSLVQYLVYPMFNSADYPLLQARLDADGIRRPAPVREPYACKRR